MVEVFAHLIYLSDTPAHQNRVFESLDWCFYVEGGTNICGDEVNGFVELEVV